MFFCRFFLGAQIALQLIFIRQKVFTRYLKISGVFPELVYYEMKKTDRLFSLVCFDKHRLHKFLSQGETKCQHQKTIRHGNRVKR